MNTFYTNMTRWMVAICMLWAVPASSQLIVNGSATAEDLANQIVGSGVTISNVVLDCGPGGSGIFTNGNSTNVGLDNGILLTSGFASNSIGPNNAGNTSQNQPSEYDGDEDLSTLTAGSINDRCVLEFDFVAASDEITVQYVFGSEEYNEYVCSQFNDIFAFFVSGPNPLGENYLNTNFALIPSTALPVFVNSINNGSPGSLGSEENCISLDNAIWYFDNGSGTTIQYDGFTLVLTATIPIVPGEEYHFKFAIADVSDSVLDSGVFIRGSSFSAFTCQAGSIFFNQDFTGEVCANDGIEDIFSIGSTSTAIGDNYAFVLTDAMNTILAINESGIFDLESYGLGIFNFYGVSYDGEISGLEVGNNISDISADEETGCVEISEPVSLERSNCGDDCYGNTQTIDGWASPSESGPGSYRDANFAGAFPSGLTVGCGENTVTLTSASVVRNFLPCIGTPAVLTGGNQVDPSCEGNSLLSQIIALTLSVGFDNNDSNFSPSSSALVGQVIVSGTFEGYTVGEFLSVANEVLGGCSDAFSVLQVIEAASAINENYLGGTVNDGFLTCDPCINNSAPTAEGQSSYAAECGADVPVILPMFADADGDELEIELEEIYSAIACGQLLTRVWIATDECGASASFTQEITITDTQAPVISAAGANATINCTAVPVFTAPTATDACDPNPTIALVSDLTVSGTCAGSYVRTKTWRAVDACGNESNMVSQTITVIDTTAPVISAAGANATVNCLVAPIFTAPTATDACDPNPSIVLVSDVTVDGACPGSYVRTKTWKAVDACGNESAAVSQSITVQDITAPSISAAGADATVDCLVAPVFTAPTATDACDPNPSIVLISDVTVDGACPGSYVRTKTWKAVDACGNESTAVSQTITVIDTTAPVISGVEEYVNVQCFEDIPGPASATATDACTGDVEVDVFGSFTGATTIHCDITTAFGPGPDWAFWVPNLAQAGISSSANFHFDSNGGHFEQFADGTARLHGTVVNSINANESFVLDMWFENKADWTTWSALGRSYKDDLNCATPTQLYEDWTYWEMVNDLSVAVGQGDLTGVSLQLKHMPANYYFGFQLGEGANNKNCNYGFSGWFTYTGFAGCVPISGHGDVNADASCEPLNPESECNTDYTYIYRAIDSSGNLATVVQTIHVEDTIAPEFAYCPENITVNCSTDVPQAPVLTATDNCSDAIVVQLADIIEGNVPCNYTITRAWYADDECGNRSFCTQVIAVVDNTAPEFTYVPGTITLECSDELPLGDATAIDNCGGATVTYEDSFEGTFCQGLYTRTFTAEDACGNSATAVQYITIVDTTAPVFDAFDPTIFVECDQFDNLELLTATDNCDETVTITYTDVLNSGGCLGVVMRTYTAADDCGNSATAVQYITITDTTAPVINTPENQTVECDNVPAMPVVTATDNCGYDVIVTGTEEITPGECENSYTIVWTWTATDYCENVSASETVITVVDTTDPTWAWLPENLTIECSDEVPAVQYPVAEDNCDEDVNVELTVETQDGECENEYTIIRIFRAFDNCGNQAMYVQYVYVVDTTAPVFNEQQSAFSFECDEEVPYVVPSVSDNCDEEVELSYTDVNNITGTCTGSITRTWTAEDNCGNVSAFVQTLSVYDETAPVITGTIEIDAPCDNYEGIFVTATDNCSEEVSIDYSDELVSGGCQGRIIRTYTATDECQNTTTFIQIITLTDEVAPFASGVTADFTVECGVDYAIEAPSFTDNCDEELSLESWSEEVSDSCPQVITYYWSAEDNCENVTVVSTTVTIEDTTAPELEVPAGYTAECSEELVYDMAYANDVCYGEIEVSVSVDTLDGDCAHSYQIIRTFTATDLCGNSSTDTQTITVQDTTAPVFAEQQSSYSYECDETIPYIEPVASDNCGEVTLTYSDDNQVTSPCTGYVYRTWTAEDECGNTSTFVQTFMVFDETAPVITGTIEIDAPCDDYEGIFVTATDNCSEEVSIDYSDELVSGGCQGRIIRTYTATDECQNTTTFVQIITLTDEVAPVASGVTADFTVECGVDYAIEAPSFTDNCDEELSLESWSEEVSDSCPQVITYYWSAEDNCDNVTVVSTTVTIEDTTAPELEVPAGYTAECSEELVYDMAYANDVCYGEIEVSVALDTLDGDCANNYQIIRTFTATDLCGNSSTDTQVITVQDTTDPQFTFVPEGGYFSCEETLNYGQAEAEDNCGIAAVTFVDATETICANSYVITRTWTATDLCGHTATAVTTYLVFDNVAPEFDQELADVYVECVDEIPAPVQVTATDNCGNAEVSVSTDVIESDECGNQTIWVSYSATDECDNVNSTGYYIYVLDLTAPVLSETPADLILECGAEWPAAPEVTATDNCGVSIQVEFEEYFFGDVPAEGSIADCDILTPERPAGNPCNYPVDWAMALFGMPTAHRYYQVSEGQFIQYPNGTIHVIATLHNAYNPGNGFNVDVEFINGMDWAEWSTQAFLTSFKADCGGIAANHPDWMYFLLNTGNATITGFGDYDGSVLNLAHAPSNNYFGFQLGNGANNYNGADNAFGGWFTYSGTFLVDGQQIMSGNAAGAGDFAFELDCCPDYYITRCWTAMDCSGNITQHCQTISYQPVVDNTPDQLVADAAAPDAVQSAVSVYPNPAVVAATFAVTIAESAKTTIEVYDLAGARVGRMELNQVIAGNEYKVSMDVSNLAAGIYMYRVINGSTTEMGRMIVAK